MRTILNIRQKKRFTIDLSQKYVTICSSGAPPSSGTGKPKRLEALWRWILGRKPEFPGKSQSISIQYLGLRKVEFPLDVIL
jgi:hypothetical protein